MNRSEYLTQARRWATWVQRSTSRPDKRRAAHKVCQCLLMHLRKGRA